MKQKMKILIAYDGSNCADAVLDDLKRAGLPREAQAIVLSVAELWLPPPSSREFLEPGWTERPPGGEKEALALAKRACEHIKLKFPAWEVEAESVSGSPAREVIDKAEKWQSDLIVIGSHGRTALGRFLLGSVSQKVVNEAHCSVRVGRSQVRANGSPVSMIIAVDGSPGAEAAVHAVASRAWPQKTEARLITSIGPFYHMTGAAIAEEEKRAQELQKKAEAELLEAGLEVSALVIGEDPKQAIVQEAEAWKADCIFVGTSGQGRLGRWLLGSVSTAVVTRAHCSVEVVRAAET
jgi:nucleotide-binding universal stress UspA family protein